MDRAGTSDSKYSASLLELFLHMGRWVRTGMETEFPLKPISYYMKEELSPLPQSPTVNLSHMLNQFLQECEGEMRERQEKAHF